MDISYNLDDLLLFIKKYNIREELKINFHGGEPLLNPKIIKDIIEKTQKNFDNPIFTTTTNGTISSEEVISLLHEYFSEISISIDGDKEIHDKYRTFKNGKGSFDIVLETINQYQKKGIDNIRFRMTFNSETVKHLSSSVIALYHCGIKETVAVPDYFDGNWTSNHIEIYTNEIKKIQNFKERINDDEFLPPIPTKNTFNIKGPCRGGYGSYNIDCNGKVYPCTYVVGNEKYCIGTVKDGIDEKKLKDLVEIYDKKIDACNGCLAIYYCDAYRCRFINELISGDLFYPSAIICNFLNANLCF